MSGPNRPSPAPVSISNSARNVEWHKPLLGEEHSSRQVVVGWFREEVTIGIRGWASGVPAANGSDSDQPLLHRNRKARPSRSKEPTGPKRKMINMTVAQFRQLVVLVPEIKAQIALRLPPGEEEGVISSVSEVGGDTSDNDDYIMEEDGEESGDRWGGDGGGKKRKAKEMEVEHTDDADDERDPKRLKKCPLDLNQRMKGLVLFPKKK